MPRKKTIKKTNKKTRKKTASTPKPTSFQSPKGMHDVLPDEQKYWEHCLAIVKNAAEVYGYQPIETPVLENTSLFKRGIGLETDIVEKEMFSFTTKGKDDLTLRPEYTAGIARAYIENGLAAWSHPVKLYHFGPVFRYEKPQAGRYRQHHQFGFEAIRGSSPILDAQIIQIIWGILEKLKIKGLNIQINSIGCPECRASYKDLLVSYYQSKMAKLCPDCRKRLKKNPLRLLDCKEDKCILVANNAPQIIDYLCEDCHNHFKSVLEYLDELELPYILNPRLVRGLDYYSKTVFEIWPEEGESGRQNSLAGGGRYDGLIELLGGKPTPAVGFAAGIERIVDLIKKQNIRVDERPAPKVFLVQLGELARKKGLGLFEEFQRAGIPLAESFTRDSIKSQLKLADRMGAKIALILGQKEAIDEVVILRDMSSGIQEIIDVKKIVKEVKKRLK